MRTGAERSPHFERRLGGEREHAARPPHARPAADGGEADALAVDAHLDRVLLARGLGELDGHDVLAIGRQMTPDDRTAPRAQRQAVQVAVLNQVAVELVAVDDRRHRRVADREPADLARGGQVPLQRRRRDEQQLGEVVEAARDVVGRQQRRDVELLRKMVERQQVADGVLVFGAAETVERRAAARVRRLARGPIERRLQPADDVAVRGVVRPGAPDRRHRPRLQLADDALPRVGVMGDVRGVERVERQAGGAQLRDQHRRRRAAAVDDPLVVARHAVSVERRLHGRGRRLPAGGRRRGERHPRRRGERAARHRRQDGRSEPAQSRSVSPRQHGIPSRHHRTHRPRPADFQPVSTLCTPLAGCCQRRPETVASASTWARSFHARKGTSLHARRTRPAGGRRWARPYSSPAR